MAANNSTVTEGAWVLLVSNEQDRKLFVRALPKEYCRLGKKNVQLRPIVGAPYGAVFEVQGGKLVRVEGPLQPQMSTTLDPAQGSSSITEDGDAGGAGAAPAAATVPMPNADNRSLVDTNTAQKLSAEQIHRMRDDKSVTGAEIIRALAGSSETFASKTEFSKQKYLRRKAQKYMVRVRVTRCEASNIMQTYFDKSREKVCGLREDSLAQLLTAANVRAGARIVVFESCMGVVTGAVAQRLGEHGQALVAYDGQQSNDAAISRYNLSQHALTRVVVNFPLDMLTMLPKSEEEIAELQDAYLEAHPRMTQEECETLAAER